MAKSRYSVDEKKKIVMQYRESTGSHSFLVAEEIAKWYNQTYHPVNELHGYDFRRPKAMKEWIDHVNDKNKIKTTPETKAVTVVTAHLIDIDHVVRSCHTSDDLRNVLRKANERFSDLVDVNQMQAGRLKETAASKESLDRELGILRGEIERCRNTWEKTELQYRRQLRQVKKELKEAKSVNRQLLEYICRYIADPVAADHFANDLKLLITNPGQKVVLPEQMRPLIDTDRSFGEIISEFDEWLGIPAGDEMEDDEMDISEETEGQSLEKMTAEVLPEEEKRPAVEVLSEEEMNALKLLDML